MRHYDMRDVCLHLPVGVVFCIGSVDADPGQDHLMLHIDEFLNLT